MSFAIIETGGKQYKVSASKILEIEKIDAEVGKTLTFKNVLLLNDDKNTEVGDPNIKGASVEAKLLANVKDRTVLVFHKRRRKHSRKKNGHRQRHSKIQITKILSKEGKLIASAENATAKTKVKAKATVIHAWNRECGHEKGRCCERAHRHPTPHFRHLISDSPDEIAENDCDVEQSQKHQQGHYGEQHFRANFAWLGVSIPVVGAAVVVVVFKIVVINISAILHVPSPSSSSQPVLARA